MRRTTDHYLNRDDIYAEMEITGELHEEYGTFRIEEVVVTRLDLYSPDGDVQVDHPFVLELVAEDFLRKHRDDKGLSDELAERIGFEMAAESSE